MAVKDFNALFNIGQVEVKTNKQGKKKTTNT